MGMKMALAVSLNIQMNFPLFVFTEDDERTKWRKLMSGRKVSVCPLFYRLLFHYDLLGKIPELTNGQGRYRRGSLQIRLARGESGEMWLEWPGVGGAVWKRLRITLCSSGLLLPRSACMTR